MASAYRADQVGSLLRPPELLEARSARADGRITEGELREAEDRAILTALEMQRRAGIDIFTDGEYRRSTWIGGIPAAVEGFVPGPMRLIANWRGEHLDLLAGTPAASRPPGAATPAASPPTATPMVIGGKLKPTRRITGLESVFLQQHAPGPFKITIPSPTWYLRGYVEGVSDTVYPTPTDALRDLTVIVHQEVKALVAEGVSYVQIDSIRYVFDFTDEERRRQWREAGVDPDQAIAENIEADNAVIAGLKRDGVTFGLHMCRGNNRSNWFAEGDYDRIAEQVFGSLQFDRFLLEYDSERAGGFEPLRYIPKGKTVVLGLISTKAPELEREEDLLRRIEEASKYVPPENLALSPQCGFASVALGNLLSWDDQQRKLELLANTARKVWG